MTTPAGPSSGQGAASGQDNPPQEDSAGIEGVIIGAPAMPPQVLAVVAKEDLPPFAVVAEEDLPPWFKPFWEHLCSLRDNQAKELADVSRDVAVIRRTIDRLEESNKRMKGVEQGLGDAEVKLEELTQESQEPINQLVPSAVDF